MTEATGIATEERRLRDELATLAANPRSRRLLQLGLRGIERGERGVTAGCWTRHGSAGCLFQHAYWEAVREGVFADSGRPGDWIGAFVGPHEYGLVIRAIGSFDRLARAGYSDVEERALLPDRVRLRQADWRAAVAQLLVGALSDGPAREEGDALREGCPPPALARSV